MSSSKPIIVLGAGHNGLTAAAYLAKQGHKVLVLERQNAVGGIAATKTLMEGYRFNTGFSDIGRVDPGIIKDLGLETRGLKPLHPKNAFFAAGLGEGLAINAEGNVSTGYAGSQIDTTITEEALARIREMASVVAALMPLPSPNIKSKIKAGEIFPWAQVALKMRSGGKREMMQLLRSLPMSAKDYLDEEFSEDRIKSALGVFSTSEVMLGPYGSGTMLNLLYRFAAGFTPVFAEGGAGMLSEALRQAVVDFGGEVRTDCGVRSILLRDGAAAGVVTDKGEVIEGGLVISSISPAQTFFELLEAGHLPIKFTRRLSHLRYKGSTATVHFALDRVPDFGVDPRHLDSWITISPVLADLEKAFDDAKYGLVSKTPALIAAMPSLLDPGMAPAGKQTLTAIVRYAPYHLKEGGYEQIPDRVADALNACAPDFKSTVLDRRMITPLDYETEYGLREGAWTHGQMALDQLLIMRPVPGWSDYRTPIAGLWLCGSGSHPGGGITCAPGRNAAKAILKHL